MEANNSSNQQNQRRRGLLRKDTKKKDRNEAAVPDPEDDRFHRVFNNDLIFDKISSFLSIADMKILCQVSRFTCDKVRNNKEFAEKTKLVVNKHSYDTVRKTEFHWKTISFELGSLQKNPELLAVKKILRNAEAIEIVDKSLDHKISNTKWANSLLTFMSSSSVLKKLSLESTVITRKFLSVLKKSAVVKALENLKELEIYKGKWADIRCIEKEEQADFALVFQELLAKTSNLSAFHFGKIDTRNSKEIHKSIVDIVDKNKESLTDLSLSIQVWRNDNLRTLVCPLLSKLNIVFKCRDVGVVKTFLRNQPLLTSLKIQALDECPLSLITCLKENSSELRQLHLKVAAFADDLELDEGDVYPTIDWSFLLNLKHLEDFAIIRCEDDEIRQEFDENFLANISVASALNNLPTRIRKIYLCGLQLSWPEDEETTAAVITTLSRFTNLTELSLFDCPDVINDEILQFICSHFTKLRVFGFSKCSTLTSFGFTGVRQDLSTGVSMKDLKGLRKLKIEHCTLEQSQPLLDCLQFLELTELELDFDSTLIITREFALALASANPSLEYLIGEYDSDEEAESITKHIKKLNPRFREAMIKYSSGNSDAMTAYGFDEEGNQTPWWTHADFDDMDDDSFFEYDDFYDDLDSNYDPDFDDDDDPYGMMGMMAPWV